MTDTDPPCTGELPETATAVLVTVIFANAVHALVRHDRVRIEAVDFYKDDQ